MLSKKNSSFVSTLVLKNMQILFPEVAVVPEATDTGGA